MFSRDKCIQSEYVQIECFRVANVFNLNTFKLNAQYTSCSFQAHELLDYSHWLLSVQAVVGIHHCRSYFWH